LLPPRTSPIGDRLLFGCKKQRKQQGARHRVCCRSLAA